MTVDWFRLLSDLKDRGWALSAISTVTGIPEPTIGSYRTIGSQPRHDSGEKLRILWCGATGKMPSEIPIVQREISRI